MATSSEQSANNIQSLIGQGYTQDQIGSFDYGKKLNSNEMQAFIAKTGASPLAQAREGMQTAASQTYEFDPNKYLPGIQQQAEAIYAPQQAQLEAIRQLQSLSYEDAKATTEKDFATQLQSEIESINSRGAFFSGGAVQREQDLGDAKISALNQLGLQATAADFANLTQQGLLAAEEAQFIQDRLYNAESGAYARWSDQRNFSYQAAVQQYQVFSQERDFARSVFESDRTFAMETEKMDMQRKEFEQTYEIRAEQFEQAKEEFNIDIKMKGLSYENALDNFKNKYANKNTGLFGNSNGVDVLDGIAAMAKVFGVNVKYQNEEEVATVDDGGTFDPDSFEPFNNNSKK